MIISYRHKKTLLNSHRSFIVLKFHKIKKVCFVKTGTKSLLKSLSQKTIMTELSKTKKKLKKIKNNNFLKFLKQVPKNFIFKFYSGCSGGHLASRPYLDDPFQSFKTSTERSTLLFCKFETGISGTALTKTPAMLCWNTPCLCKVIVFVRPTSRAAESLEIGKELPGKSYMLAGN